MRIYSDLVIIHLSLTALQIRKSSYEIGMKTSQVRFFCFYAILENQVGS